MRQEGWQIETRGDGYHRLLDKEKLPPKGIRKPISRKDRYLVFHNDHSRCRICGLGVTDGKKLTVDHIITVEWGGLSEMSNYQALFDAFPNQDIPSSTIQLISKGSLDWQRALRRIRQKTGKKILPVSRALGKSIYQYFKV